ncbi:NAD+ synthetase [Formivibrio citricus]|uniref:Glutamine-dependent NAD(+) synthetase n=1 Tax=Formivibrio citricus TaxID=83765 RepID=A0A1I5D7S7_9NEIS|nr:NAD+ synthase [Formivibrio citricus]SFN94891.1 NAD+ synthetase [Formivibrio citricus]
MNPLRITLAQINPTIGDIEGNIALMRRATEQAQNETAQLVVFPELSLTGYYPGDLLDEPDFLRQIERGLAQLLALTRDTPGLHWVIGAPTQHEGPGKRLQNSLLVLADGEIVLDYAKQLLPTYNIFDERRHFEPGPDVARVLRIGDTRIGFMICEDGWNDEGRDYAVNPFDRLADAAPDLVISINASPSNLGKREVRHRLLAAASRRHKLPLVYVNQIGGHDQLVYDGASFTVTPDHGVVFEAPQFAESVTTLQFDGRDFLDANNAPLPAPQGNRTMCLLGTPYANHSVFSPSPSTGEGWGEGETGQTCTVLDTSPPLPYPSPARGEGKTEVVQSPWSAPSSGLPVMEFYRRQIVLGLRDYARRCGFKRAVVGSSGGIDSALTLALASEALGADNVAAITLPSKFSSAGSVDDSKTLCDNLGVKLIEHPIRDLVASYGAGFETAFGTPLQGLPLENLQARIRGTILMEYSNAFGHLLLTTGNKSELSVGYCTLYGDTNGGLGLIGDLYKTEVFELCRHLNAEAGRELIPRAIIDKEPSAELAPGQRDTDSLPPYPVLDVILKQLIEGERLAEAERAEVEQSFKELAATADGQALIARIRNMIARNEYKRRQAPPILRLRGRAFGHGRQMPIAASYRFWRQS